MWHALLDSYRFASDTIPRYRSCAAISSFCAISCGIQATGSDRHPLAGAERSRPSKSLAKRPPVCYAHAHMGTLYYADNLGILQRYIADASVDLVYLGPPFKSAQNTNAFF